VQPGDLELSVHRCGASVLVRLTGELDLATRELLDALLDPLLQRSARPVVRRLVVDCAELTYLDASGLTPLLHARAVLRRRGGTVELRAVPPPAHRVLEVLGLADQLLGNGAPTAR